MNADFCVTIRGSGHAGVVRPHGSLTGLTQPQLRRVLTTVLRDHGRAVVDLGRCRLGRNSCVTVFTAVLDSCGGWPRARLAVYRPDGGMARALTQRGVSALVPVCQSMPEARLAIEQRPSVVRIRTRLACDDHAPDVARRLVRENCPHWQVDAERQQIGELVVSELVDNAVKHARSPAVLTLQRGPTGLRIAVRDTAPAPCLTGRLPEYLSGQYQTDSTTCSGSVRRRGRGLELVARLSSSWGIEKHPVGKTVWAEITRPGWETEGPSRQSVTGPGQATAPLPSATSGTRRAETRVPSIAELTQI